MKPLLESDGEARRCFSAADQQQFAAWTGDYNPMHVDAGAARRTQAGAPVVHGMHAVVWALDCLCRAGALRATGALTVHFRKFVYVDAPCILSYAASDDGLRATVTSGGLRCIDVTLAPAGGAASDIDPGDAPMVTPAAARELAFDHIAGRRGRLPLAATGAAAGLFPSLCGVFGSRFVAALGTLSTLVGMVCPGLHSIFAGFSVEATPGDDRPWLAFAVDDVDERFRSIRIAVAGGGMTGIVDAFVRHPPIARASASTVAERVARDAFGGVSALVIGGSRGLGAVTAQLLAAGGARVALTYRSGRDEAFALAAEAGVQPRDVLAFDTSLDASEQLAALGWTPDQVYYFPTPHIARERGETYSHERFTEFCAVYVDAFERLVRVFAGDRTAFFYPSSVFVVERPRKMTEYAMAKAAGEILCADLDRAHRHLAFLSVRLPRVLTDQTASVVPVETEDAVDVMLPIVRAMTALRR